MARYIQTMGKNSELLKRFGEIATAVRKGCYRDQLKSYANELRSIKGQIMTPEESLSLVYTLAYVLNATPKKTDEDVLNDIDKEIESGVDVVRLKELLVKARTIARKGKDTENWVRAKMTMESIKGFIEEDER